MGEDQVDAADDYVLALDEGTTNAKALAVDSQGRVRASASRPVPVSFPQPGWVEQDAEQIYAATCDAARDVMAQMGTAKCWGIAISSQRESAVIWSAASGRPLGPVLGWQDSRTADECAVLSRAHGDSVTSATGLPLDPMYSAPKMRWLRDRALAAGAASHDIRLGTVDSWLIWNLTGAWATEAGNASRTLLFGLRELDWDASLLEIFDIPRDALPPVLASDGHYGVTVATSGLPEGLPILAVMADSHAALFAQGCTEPGQAKATYGTGSSVMALCAGLPDAPPAGVTTTLAWLMDTPTYALEGNILATGAALDWVAQLLGLPQGGPELSALAAQVDSTAGLTFVPALAGLGAPYWDRGAVGLISGITAGAQREHVARAALESVAHQVADVIDAINAGTSVPVHSLAVDGGATSSDLLMHMQADLIGCPVHVTGVAEASAMGVALVALGKLGADPHRASTSYTTLVPHLDDAGRDRSRAKWHAAVTRSRSSDSTQSHTAPKEIRHHD